MKQKLKILFLCTLFFVILTVNLLQRSFTCESKMTIVKTLKRLFQKSWMESLGFSPK